MNRMIRSVLLGVMCLGAAGVYAQDAKPISGDAYKSVAEFKFGDSRKNLAEIEAEIRGAKAEQYAAIEAKLLELLGSEQTQPDAKRFLARYLATVGSEKSVPTLARLLSDEKLSHPARMALEAMGSPAAGDALRASLEKLHGNLLAGAIGSEGAIRDTKAVPALAKLAAHDEKVVAEAAIAALGQIGNGDAAAALTRLAANPMKALEGSILRAQITCADRLAQSGNKAQAIAIYKGLMNEKIPLAQRGAAARGLILLSDRSVAVAQAVELLQGKEADLREAALAAFRNTADAGLRSGIVEKLPTLSGEAQVSLLTFLLDFRDVPARQSVLSVMQSSSDEGVRAAAIRCLSVHGEVGDVPMLVKLAASGATSAEKDAARAAVDTLGKPGVDPALIRLIESNDPAQRGVVIAALATRNASSALPALVKLLGGSDATAAAEAAGAIGTLGGTEQLGAMVSTIEKSSDGKVREAAERAASSLVTRVADPEASGKVVLAALERAKETSVRLVLLRLLPRVKGEAALAAAAKATKDSDSAVREASLRALAEWSDASAAAPLFEVANSTDNEKLSILAMQGAIRLGGLREVSNADRVKIYQQVLESAKRVDEKKRAVSGLGDVPSADAIALLEKQAENPELTGDVAQAAMRMARQRPQGPPAPRASVVRLLEKLQGMETVNEELKKQLKAAGDELPAGRRGRQ